MSNARMIFAGSLLLALVLSAGTGTALAQPAGPGIEVVELPSASSPLVALRLQFNVGSIHDPAGKEGLAALTAAMISDSGTQKRSYTDLVEALYPLAADISGNTDR